MGSLTRRLRNTYTDQLINKAIRSGELKVVAPDGATARRVVARAQKRNIDLEKLKVVHIKDDIEIAATIPR
jgi:hypothetical protein